MATFVFFHAHPDDEAIITAGTMVLAKQAGHRTVLVVATSGEEGEVEDEFLTLDQSLTDVRLQELRTAAAILGADRVELLGYRDSGMMGTVANQHPESFWRADVEQAAAALAAVLIEEQADVLTVYDNNGGYGHPDHIQVHRVGTEAAHLAETPRLFEATFEREYFVEASNESGGPDAAAEAMEVGKPAVEITAEVDVTSVIDVKAAAMRAHPSQIGEDSWFLSMSEERFGVFFGTEWFIQVRPPISGGRSQRDDWLL